jgi:plasmid stabilization system protein ParE
MIERVIFTPEADDDVAGAYDWYESREPGLGEDFLRSVEACIRSLQRHPEMYPAASMSFGARRFAAFRLRFSTS